jgi:hypothetical protein
LDVFPYLEHVENITVTKSQPPRPLSLTKIYSGAGTPQIYYITELSECDAQGCLEKHLQNNPYYPCATREEYKHIQYCLKKEGMKRYHGDVLKQENTAVRFPKFKNGDGIQKLVASMPDGQARGEWALHTLEDMRSNDNHQRRIKYCSRDIIKRMTWLMLQPTYAEHLNFAPQRYFNSDMPPKCLYTEMHTVHWWLET